MELSFQIVDLARQIGIDRITIIGGEPLLWEHLPQLNTYCKKNGIVTNIVTNASRFGDDKYWEQYLETPCDGVGISIKSADPKQFMDIVSSNLFEQTQTGISRAIRHYHTGISTVYSNLLSTDDIKTIAETYRNQGAGSFMLNICSATLSGNTVSSKYMVDPHKMAKDIMLLHPFLDKLYAGNISIEMFLPLCLWPKEFISVLLEKGQLVATCHVQERTGLVFDRNGDILPCNSMVGCHIAKWNRDFFDAESLTTHLNSRSLTDIYKNLLRYPSAECGDCDWNNRCRGGCILNWTVFDPDKLCISVKGESL
jgi:radical SAM protein with 4Fe4S-binding SPASM domain